MKKSIKIDKGIPVPPHRNIRMPWLDMEVGNSVFRTERTGSHVMAGKKSNRLFTMRAVIEKGVNGFRIWRVK